MPRYLVLGNVGVHVDSDSPIQIGSVTIGTRPPRPALKSPLPTGGSTFPADVVRIPPDVRIRTNASLWCHVVADTELEAIAAVRSRELVVLRYAMSRSLGRVVDAEATWAYPVMGGPGAGDISSALGIMPLGPAALPSTNVMDEDFTAVDADGRCRVACNHLDRARSLVSAQAYLGPPAGDAAVLEYTKALEFLATDKDLHQPVDAREEQREQVISDLSTRLERARSTKQRAAAVMSSADALKRLDRKFLDQRVTAMAQTLDLPPKWLEVARRLIRARNSKAAHPGDTLEDEARRLLLYGAPSGPPNWSSSVDWMMCEAITAVAQS